MDVKKQKEKGMGKRKKTLSREDLFFEFRFGNVRNLNVELVTPSHFHVTSFSFEMTSFSQEMMSCQGHVTRSRDPMSHR
jgi:hypothetical protein